MTAPPRDPGRIITFYSYKGGTGRSMALANVAWILASNGYRVLVVDWDLEAPGLHRYFSPFLLDPDLVESDGVIDIVSNYVTALMTPPIAPPPAPTKTIADPARATELRRLVALLTLLQSRATSQPSARAPVPTWHHPYADVLRYATSLTWRFPPHEGRQGWIDFIPAGRQGPSYGARMNAFNWQNFYDRLGGGGFIEALKQRMKEEYDFTLIDSRTGVSDTAGVCTVQLPDVLAVCFTLNRQSIEGASSVATATRTQRAGLADAGELRIFPIPTRVERAEKQKLDLAHDAAADAFAEVLEHVDEDRVKQYWGDVEVLYEPFYAYEEVLSTFRDTPGQPTSMLASMERITGWLTGRATTLVPPDDLERQRVLTKYARESRTARGKAGARGGAEFLFYISYARADLDESLERFFTDLTREVRAVTGGATRGFVDLDIAAGTDWQQQLEQAIQVSRVLVPIYSPAYFGSESAGREFQAFLSRRTATSSAAILPVVWVQPPHLPVAAQPIQYTSKELPDVYTNLGLRSLMRLRRYEDAYAEFLKQYAALLIAMARQASLPAGEQPSLSQLPSAFVLTTSPGDSPARSPIPAATADTATAAYPYTVATPEGIQALLRAAPTLDRETLEVVIEEDVIPRIRGGDSAVIAAAPPLIDEMKKRRAHVTVGELAVALLESRHRDAALQLDLAAALINQGRPAAALPTLRALEQSPLDQLESERLAVIDLLAEACTRLFLESNAPLLPASRQNLLRAIRAYIEASALSAQTLWYGINVVALVRRALNDGISIPEDVATALTMPDEGSTLPLWEAVARRAERLMGEVQKRVDDGEAGFWDFAVAGQAALTDPTGDAVPWFASCVHGPAEGFQLETLLRHVQQVWRPEPSLEVTRRTLPLLRAAVLQHVGGTVVIPPSDLEPDRSQLRDYSYQKLLGTGARGALEWYMDGVPLGGAAAAIEVPERRTVASALLVEGKDLNPAWTGPYAVTLASIVDAHGDTAVRSQVFVSLPDALAGDISSSIAVSVRSPALDVCVAQVGLRLFTPGVLWARRPPLADGRTCVYVFSRSPEWHALTIASCLVLDHDATRLHVRVPDVTVLPGSPVFNTAWELVGIYRGTARVPRLNGKTGTYRVADVMWAGAIRRAIADAGQAGT
jgi:hypothetical protein